MRKFFFIFILSCFLSNAQNGFDRNLFIGSFNYEGYQVPGMKMNKSAIKTVITFFSDSVFQEQAFNLSKDSVKPLQKMAGKWKLLDGNRVLDFSARHTVPYVAGMRSGGFFNHIVTLNDTLLVLKGGEGMTDILMYYRKTKNLARFEDNYVRDSLLPLSYNSWSPVETHRVSIDFDNYEDARDKYYFVNTLDSTKTKRIKNGGQLLFVFELPLKDSSIISKNVRTYGDVVGVIGTNLAFGVRREHTDQSMKSGYTSNVENDFEDFAYSSNFYGRVNLRHAKIELLKFNAVNYSRTPNATAAIGGFFCASSVATAIFIAPLVSINYKTGAFNDKRYFTLLKGAALVLPVGITFAIIRKDRDFKISQDRSQKGKDIWYIMQKD